jgi:endo-1,4-beta-D-glucanase Y
MMLRSLTIGTLALALAACGGGSTNPGSSDAAIVSPGDPDAAIVSPGDPDAAIVPPDPPDAAPPPPPPPPPQGHPFGTHGGYFPTGVIFPSNHTQAQLDQQVKDYYDDWKAAYIKPGCSAGQYRIKTGDGTDAYTVSEGHGYAMLVMVIMHGHDPQAHAIFDGLYAYYHGHPSTNNPALMAWAQNASCNDVEGADSATDGDLDIAYALLLAHRQWGSTGAIDYQQAASTIIAGALAGDIHPSASTILVGDWTDSGDEHYTGTRPSDFMVSHFKSFAAKTGEARWTAVTDKTYSIVAYLQQHNSPNAGLLPDFVVNATGNTPAPAPSNWLEGSGDGRYAYNSCRVPWRLATDYLMSGDARSQTAVRAINTWIRATTGDTPGNVKDGYKLDGTSTGSDPELAFVAPFGVSAMVQPASGTNQPWLNKLWDYILAQGLSGYYSDTIKMLDVIVMSGNWWTP